MKQIININHERGDISTQFTEFKRIIRNIMDNPILIYDNLNEV